MVEVLRIESDAYQALRRGGVYLVEKEKFLSYRKMPRKMDTIFRNVMLMEILWQILGLCVSQEILLR